MMYDYGLFMRKVMAHLALVADGGVMKLEPSRISAEHPSRLLLDMNSWKSDDGEYIYVSLYWLQERWYHAWSQEARRELIALALEVLRLATRREWARYDMGTLEGRLAVGRHVLSGEWSIQDVMRDYGYSRSYVYDLMERARVVDELAHNEREALRKYDGSLEARVRIAAEPGSIRDVSEKYGLHYTTVGRWRQRYASMKGVAHG